MDKILKTNDKPYLLLLSNFLYIYGDYILKYNAIYKKNGMNDKKAISCGLFFKLIYDFGRGFKCRVWRNKII